MPEILAHAPDGAVLHFPDGTDPSVIQGAIKKHISSGGQLSGFADKLHGNPQDQTVGNPDLSKIGAREVGVVPIARTVLPPAAGLAAGTLAAPSGPVGSIAAGTGAYTLVDALLKQLQSGKKTGIGEDLLSSGAEGLVNETGGRVLSGIGSAIKSYNKLGTPDAGSLLKLNPTASQALASTESHPTITAILKFLEDRLAPGAKAKAQSESAKLGSEAGLELAADETGRSWNSTVRDPHKMVQLISGEMVPEESYQAIKIKQRTADIQPISIVKKSDLEAPYQPVKFQDRPITPQNPVSGGKQAVATGDLKTQNYPQGTETRATGPVEQVPIPGAYEILPGVVKKTPFATDPDSLRKLIKDPVRLEKALTESQAAGVGFNVRQDLAGFKLADLQREATSVVNGKMHIDTDALQNYFNTVTKEGADAAASNRILFKGSNNLSNVQQFYKNLAYTQDKPGTGRLLTYANSVGIPMALLHSAISGNLGGVFAAGGAVALELGAKALAKTLTSKESGRLMLSLANREPLGVSDQYAARMLVKALSGTTVYVVGSNGERTPARFNNNGDLNPIGQH